MIRTAFQTIHPFVQLIFFFCLMLTGLGLASGLGLLGMAQWSGQSMESAIRTMSAPDSPLGRTYNLVLNSANQLLSFAAAALAARYLFKGQTMVSSRGPRPWTWLIWAVVFAWCAQPFIDITYRLNGELLQFLPEDWVRAADSFEAMAQQVTLGLLTFDSAWQFPATLVAVAILPAVCEELAFRGVVQPLVARWTGSIHWGVWISAVLFSAIHMQFHGFLPRMILGAGLGYLVVYSGSLWPAVIAHFCNNAAAVIMAALYGPTWIEEEMVAMGAWESPDYIMAVMAVMIGGFGVKWIMQNSTNGSKHPTTESA
ncbi:MAG: CPBP family intramembrane metalloprotease [Flavobacteriales bacterium]|nr:CPBP family intramembrane metalloprotease [Flavobacteriales bacterium]